jgi:signal transduction histidine kinase
MVAGALVVSILLAIVLGNLSVGETARLGAVAAFAVAGQGIFLPGWHRRLLGAFAAPVELTLELVLALFALSLTGGARSDLYTLLLLDMVLAYRFAGREAARFLTVATVLGLAYLTSLSLPASSHLHESLLPLALRGLWPVALLLGLEFGGHEVLAEAEPASTERFPSTAALPPAARREFFEEVLHDLKSPLSVLRAYTDLIAEEARRGESPSDEHLVNLRRELELMESIVGIRPRWDPPHAATGRADLVPILSSLAEVYRAAYGDRLRVEFMADQPEIPVLADAVALQRAFRNVLDNSVKYTPAAGQVRIRASVRSDKAYVVFTDSGVGMTPEEQMRAFEFSYRGPGARASGAEGKGLGLGLSRELLEANGGKISLLSELGHGLEVTVALPVFRERRA